LTPYLIRGHHNEQTSRDLPSSDGGGRSVYPAGSTTLPTMRRYRMKPLLTIAVLFLLLTTWAGAYEVYTVNPPVSDYLLLTNGPLTPPCQLGNTLDIMACRGEYEPASFVIQTGPDEHLDNVRVGCSPLRSAGTALPISTVDIRLVDKSVVGCCIGRAVAPIILVHDAEMITVVDETPTYYANLTEEDYVSSSKGGIIPDWGNYPETLEEYKALYATENRIVKELIDAHTLRPVDIPKREQFWLTVHIPEDAQPGDYVATIRIVPANAPGQKLKLNVWVPDIELLPPREVYGIYYATMLQEPTQSQAYRDKYGPITDRQMVLEYENMAAHGCTNPIIYAQVVRRPDGSLDYQGLSNVLDVREEVGIPRGELFIGDGTVKIAAGLTEEGDYERNVEAVKEIQVWATARGYGKVYYGAGDEWAGQKLLSEYDAMKSVEEGGGGVWVACGMDFAKLVGDVLAVAIVQPPDSGRADRQQHTALTKDVLLAPDEYAHWRPESLLVPEWQDMIRGVHERGKRIFTYMDPWGGWPLADDHRRVRGFGMWLAGIDGTMTWSYAGIHGGVGATGIAMRAKRGVLDILAWEGYREGYDDSRYIATLLAAGGEEWLKAQPQERITKGNLDELRREVAEEILRLQNK